MALRCRFISSTIQKGIHRVGVLAMQDQTRNTDHGWTKSEYKERLWQTVCDLAERLPLPQSLIEVVSLFKEELTKSKIDKDELVIMMFDAAVLICFEPNELTKLALETCRQMLETKPNDPRLLRILAYLYYWVFDELDEAIKTSRYLVEIEPSYENWDFLLYLLKRSGNIQEMKQILNHLKNSSSPEYLRLVARYLNELGEYQKAIHILKVALKLQSHHPSTWGILAEAYEMMGKFKYALNAYENALKFAEMCQWHQDTSGIKKGWMDWWRHKIQELRSKQKSDARKHNI